MRPEIRDTYNPLPRIRFWYALLLILGGIFIVRLFYLQVIRHDHYQKSATFSQLKVYEIPASRGVIYAKNGDKTVPLVLNETLYTLYADPAHVKDAGGDAGKIQNAIGGSKEEYEKKLKNPDSPRYTVLAKRLTHEQHQKIEGLKLKGIGTREAQYRSYPDGQLAAQLLGFVNDDGQGRYGLEQALDDKLKGTPGKLKAITDAKGVPLASSKDNVSQAPVTGDQVTLTVDIGLQQQLEDILKTGLDKAKSQSGSALILDANTGAIKAMASYPTYNPAEYFKVKEEDAFNNTNTSAPLEVGSIMKPLTTAAALDVGAVGANTSYYDPGVFRVDDATIRNVEEVRGAATRSVGDILKYSLNTGATWLLMQMGGGEINRKARVAWHDYMVNHYQLGRQTGVEQGFEATGTIPDPVDGFGLNITYANTAFGQGMTATPLQMAAAFASVINGGTYNKPHLIESTINGNGKEDKKRPEAVRRDVVKPEVGRQVQDMLVETFSANRVVYGSGPFSDAYMVGGKTGTAQITKPEGGYYDDRFNGMYMGFVGGDRPEYVIVVRVNEPKIAGYAGSKGAAPIFVSLANMLINSYGVTPKATN